MAVPSVMVILVGLVQFVRMAAIMKIDLKVDGHSLN